MAELAEVRKRLKQWESTFIKEHGRKPGRSDIDGASKDIQDTYLKYSKLKKGQTNPEDKIIEPAAERKQKTSLEDVGPAVSDSATSEAKAENQTSEGQPGKEAQSEVWGMAFNRENKADPAKQKTVEMKASCPSFLKNISDKMFKQSVMLEAKQLQNKSSSPLWKKPDTPHPGKALTRNPFREPLPSPFLTESAEENTENMQEGTERRELTQKESDLTSGNGHYNDPEDARQVDRNKETMEMEESHSLSGSTDTGQKVSSLKKPTSLSTSVFQKALKVTRMSNVKATRSNEADVYLGRFQTSKSKQKVLPKGLSALVSKHMEKNEASWEPDYDEVDGECEKEDGVDKDSDEDLDTGKHAWDVSVKSLIIDDMVKSKSASRRARKSVKCEKDTKIKETKNRTASSEFNDEADMNEELQTSIDDFDQAMADEFVYSLEKDVAKIENKPRAARADTIEAKIPSEDDSDAEENTKKTAKRVTMSRKRKPVIEDSPESVNMDDSVKDATEPDEEGDDCSKGKKRKAKGSKPAAKKRKIQAAAEMQDEEAKGSGLTSKPVKKAAPRAKPVSNDNFVRLNMKIKTYKRKGRHLTGPQYKRKMWKEKMSARSKSYGDACFKCGQPGHWANKCPGIKSASHYEKEPVMDEDFPSMQEAAMIARGIKPEASREPRPQKVKEADKPDKPTSEPSTNVSTDFPDDDLELDIQTEVVRSRQERASAPPAMKPLIQCEREEELPETPTFVKQGLKKFGYDSFRPGQEEAVMRILCGLSTLVVLSTGGGKSLCYQLPAYLYSQAVSCFTLVISPLVSLMEDQVTGLPHGVNGVCMHTNMTAAQREKVLTAVKDGKAQFLLVSPEAIAGGSMTLIGAMASLPPVAFVCIDESHCLSEWSHNFRPSYLRLCKVLYDKLGIQCFLGLTATATLSTAADVSRHLKITNFRKAMVRGSPVPTNLFLSVSRDEDREQALVGLLQGERFCHLESIIIYCTRRDQTDKVATIIRTCLNKGPPLQAGKGKKKKGPKLEWDAESYHAGLTPAQRKRVQNAFMSGRLRVVVATVAFGMGLDKSDVRGVIHYNMPKSFESYVQEIGRAGRDGEPAQCHLFLDPEGRDLCELRRHTYANTVDYRTLKKLVQKVFPACRCRDVHQRHAEAVKETIPSTERKPAGMDAHDQTADQTVDGVGASKEEFPEPCSSERLCPGHERSLPIEQTVMELDVKEEGISTLLCYLELHDGQWMENLSHVYHNCKIQCYGGPGQLQAISKKCPPVAVAIAKARSHGKTFTNTNTVEFPVVEISDTMGWDSGPVKKELKLLQWNFNTGTTPSRSGVMVEFSDLAFHFRSLGDFSPEELDDILQFLHDRVQRQEKSELVNLSRLYHSLKSVSHKNYWMCADSIDMSKNDKLKAILNKYFDDQENPEDPRDISEEENIQIPEYSVGQVISDIHQFYGLYGQEHTLTGRAVARIFHGIASPCYPATTWGRVRRFWRSHLNVDFNELVKLGTKELISMRQ